MNKIKFSNEYDKIKGLNGCKAQLISVDAVEFEKLDNEFLKFDSRYQIGLAIDYYKFEKTNSKYILLVFYSEDTVFTTLRPFNGEKYEYYCDKQYEYFEIVIEKKGL